jgi:hypothetical protein
MCRSAGAKLLASLLIAASLPAAALAQPAESPSRRIRYFTQEWSFDDVDVATLARRLARVGLELPVSLSGRVSGTLSVGVPWGALSDARAWRLGGTLTSNQLSVDDWTVRNARARLAYRDGVLRLEELRLQAPPQGAELAPNDELLTGAAAMELVPRGQFTASTTVRGLSISQFLRRLAGLAQVGGQLSGSLNGEVDVDQLAELQAWRISGPVSLEGLTFRESPSGDVTAQLALRDGVLTAERAKLTLGPATITTDGRLSLVGEQKWNVTAILNVPELPALLDLLEELLEVEAIGQAAASLAGGSISATAELNGALTQRTINASGPAELSNVEIQPPADLQARLPLKPVRIATLAFDYALADEALRLSQIVATLAGGRATGEAIIPLGDGDATTALEWNSLRLTEILAEPFVGSGTTNGSLNLTVPNGQWGDFSLWQLQTNVNVTEIRYGEWSIANIQTGNVTLAEGRLRVPAFAAQVDGQPLTASVDMLLAAPHSIDATFNLARFPLPSLRRVPQFAEYANRFDGVVAASGRFSGTWQPLRLSGDGRIAGRSIRLDQYAVDSIELDFAASPDQVVLSNINAAVYRGAVAGSATVALGEAPGATAALEWTGVDAAAATRGLLGPPITAAGATSGSVSITIPPGALNDRARWTGAGAMQLDQLSIYELPFLQLRAAQVQLANGRLSLPQVTATLDGRSVTASAALAIAAPHVYNAELRFDQVRVEHLGTLLQVGWLRDGGRGRVDFTAKLQGLLDPLELAAVGTVAGGSVTLFGHPIDRISFAYDYTKESLALTGVDATLYDGRLSGEVRVPLVDGAEGSARVAWNHIDVGRSLGALVELPVELSGHSDGTANVAIPAGALNRLAEWNVDARVSLPNLSAAGLTVASLDANLRQQNRELAYTATGSLFGGVLRAEGNRDATDPGEGLSALGDVELTLRGASLSTATQAALEPSERPGPIEGTFDVTLLGSNTDRGWAWRSDLTVAQVRASGVAITDGVQLRISGDERLVRIEQLSGQFAGGQLSGSGRWLIGGQRAPVFRIALRSAQMERLAALGDLDESPVAGPIDIELAVRPGAVWRISGAVGTGQGALSGLRFSNVRIPLDAEWHPASGRLRLQAPTVAISLAGGRITGRLTAQRTAGWMLDGAFRFFRVDFVTLVRQFGSASQYGSGRLTGTLTLTGRNMRTVNDLQATLQADLEDSQAGNLPILSDLWNYIPGASSTATRFQEGRLEARLARGVITVQQLTLASSQLDLYITGTINLAGRLALEAIVYTGQQENPLLARFLLQRFAEVAAPPAALLASANDFLSNRVLRLEIRGTIHRPIIRVRPLAILRDEIVRYMLRRAAGAVLGTGVPAPAVTAGDRN